MRTVTTLVAAAITVGLAGSPAVDAAYLATHVKQLRTEVKNSLVLSAGDNIGASPLDSALFHAAGGVHRAPERAPNLAPPPADRITVAP